MHRTRRFQRFAESHCNPHPKAQDVDAISLNMTRNQSGTLSTQGEEGRLLIVSRVFKKTIPTALASLSDQPLRQRGLRVIFNFTVQDTLFNPACHNIETGLIWVCGNWSNMQDIEVTVLISYGSFVTAPLTL